MDPDLRWEHQRMTRGLSEFRTIVVWNIDELVELSNSHAT